MALQLMYDLSWVNVVVLEFVVVTEGLVDEVEGECDVTEGSNSNANFWGNSFSLTLNYLLVPFVILVEKADQDIHWGQMYMGVHGLLKEFTLRPTQTQQV